MTRLSSFLIICLLGSSIALSASAIFPEKGPAWLLNFDSACLESKKQDRLILMVFSGSDWCKPCILLNRILFESTAFSEFANKHLILLKVDFPAYKKNKLSSAQNAHNEELADRFNPDGLFPLVLIVNAAGEVKGSFGYEPAWKRDDYFRTMRSIIGLGN